LVKVAVSHNRHERVSSEDGFDLIELTTGCSLRVQSVTTPKEGPYSRGRAVGVDCEYASQDIDIELLMPLVFSNREIDAARHRSSEDKRDTFYRVWVAKEAYLKATGLGLSLDLTKVHIEWDNLRSHGMVEVTGKPEEQGRWRLRMLPAPLGHYAALVVDAGREYPH
jgi:phosphopantetheinyl transferase (holo-ACP synthase)